VWAVVLEDRAGHRVLFADADFPITRAVADFVAVHLVKTYELDRADVVVSGAGAGTPDTAEILATIQQALAAVGPATLTGGSAISIHTGAACAAIPLRAPCADGPPLHGRIRAAFQMVDLPHPLQTRDAATQGYPVQAVAIGKVTVLALGGDAPAAHPALPDEPRLRAAVANVLRRVR
jgi:hypothetical protein